MTNLSPQLLPGPSFTLSIQLLNCSMTQDRYYFSFISIAVIKCSETNKTFEEKVCLAIISGPCLLFRKIKPGTQDRNLKAKCGREHERCFLLSVWQAYAQLASLVSSGLQAWGILLPTAGWTLLHQLSIRTTLEIWLQVDQIQVLFEIRLSSQVILDCGIST